MVPAILWVTKNGFSFMQTFCKSRFKNDDGRLRFARSHRIY
jgi:hypothetical protein